MKSILYKYLYENLFVVYMHFDLYFDMMFAMRFPKLFINHPYIYEHAEKFLYVCFKT